MYFKEHTASELNLSLRNLPVILPIAAIEQHGPHLPVATDELINEALCAGLEARNTEAQLILPTVSVGCSGHHLDFGGTLTTSHRTFMVYLEEILQSVAGQGFFNLILLNSHGGNMSVMKCVCEEFALKNKKINLMGITWWQIISEDLKKLCGGDTINSGHACQLETSILMATCPEKVRTEKIQDGKYNPIPDWARSDMLAPSGASPVRTILQSSSNGVQGTPSKASPEIGKQILSLFVEAMTPILQDFAKFPPRDQI